MNRYEVTVRGTTALVMHNVNLADPDNKFTKSIAEITKKRKKTSADRQEIARLEFLGGLYHDEQGPYIPALSFQRALEGAGKIQKMGATIEKGVVIDGVPHTEKIPLIYDGPRDPASLWEAKDEKGNRLFVYRAVVGIQKSKVVRVRPQFEKWSCTFLLTINPQVVDDEAVLMYLDWSGGVGVLDGRKIKKGRFTIESIKKTKI